LGCRFIRSEFFCSTWCHWSFYGSSAEDGALGDGCLTGG
jgi:hypothetical protein